ncbi:MAG: hypothetical protein PHR14_10495 [Oscillospiraceae bacterium]|nr:hypothetical protein [Oscillospiraceae bacterium]
MSGKKKSGMYAVERPIVFDNWNEYFVRAARERDDKYFAHFLCRYETKLDGIVEDFIKTYHLDSGRLDDLKQLFAYVVWTNLQKYDPDDEIPFLQLVKYKVISAWHDYVRTCCGETFIDSANAYRLIRKSAFLFFSEDNPHGGIEAVMESLELSEEKAIQMILLAKQFKYADRIGLDDPDENEFEIGVTHEYELPPSPSAEDEYLRAERRTHFIEAATKLSPKQVQIIEQTVGVCLSCLGLLPRKTYEQVALLQGAADASVIERRRKRALAKLRESLS